MKCIIGLGNPGKEYEVTRHNVGFMVIDALAQHYGIDVSKQKFQAIYGEGRAAANRIVLVKPQTYMNLSGQSVRAVLDWYKLSADDIVVVHDDMDLEPGRIRLRVKGSSGGHNGIKSIISHLGTEVFPRMKLGIGRPKEGTDTIAHVLNGFTQDEKVSIEEAMEKAVKLADIILRDGFDKAIGKVSRV